MVETLELIGADVRACELCKLCRTRTVGVPGEGSPTAEVMFIGEGPGFHEDQQGRPSALLVFGKAGTLADEHDLCRRAALAWDSHGSRATQLAQLTGAYIRADQLQGLDHDLD